MHYPKLPDLAIGKNFLRMFSGKNLSDIFRVFFNLDNHGIICLMSLNALHHPHTAPCASRVAQWKRAGPITQRSVDRNHALLMVFSLSPATKFSQNERRQSR